MIPNPHWADISADLIKKILRQGEISIEEWLSASEKSFQDLGKIVFLLAFFKPSCSLMRLLPRP